MQKRKYHNIKHAAGVYHINHLKDIHKEVPGCTKNEWKGFCEAVAVLHFSQFLLQGSSPDLALCEIT